MSNMFGTKQNNDYNTDKKSVNTNIYQFKNKEGFEPSTLQIRGWDEMLSMRINPALEPSKQSKEQIFDYERFVATSLNMEKAMLLLYKINKDIIPAIENDEEKNIGINVGGDSLITVGTGKKITGSIKPYLAIFKGLNPDTKKPEQSIFYEFKTSMTIDDYDANTGNYTVNEGYQAELYLFMDILKSFIQSAAVAHNIRYNTRYTSDRLVSNVTAIANKVGADTGYKSSGSSYGPRRNVFGSSNANTSNSFNSDSFAEMEELGDLNDLMN